MKHVSYFSGKASLAKRLIPILDRKRFLVQQMIGFVQMTRITRLATFAVRPLLEANRSTISMILTVWPGAPCCETTIYFYFHMSPCLLLFFSFRRIITAAGQTAINRIIISATRENFSSFYWPATILVFRERKKKDLSLTRNLHYDFRNCADIASYFA